MMTGQARRRKGVRRGSPLDENNNVLKRQANVAALKESKKLEKKDLNANDLAVLEMSPHSKKNKLLLALVLYIGIGAGVLYIRGGVSLPGIPAGEDVQKNSESSNLQTTNETGQLENKSLSLSEMPPNTEKIIANVTLPKKQEKTRKTSASKPQNQSKQQQRNRFPDFQPNILNHFEPSPILSNYGKIEQRWKEMKPKRNISSSVRVYIMDNFLSSYECDGLMRVHNSHVAEHKAHDPVVCFSDVHTMKQYLTQTDVEWRNRVDGKDFMTGTYCLNETLSAQLDGKLRWSSSTSFYPGESKFSTVYEEKVQRYTGFDSKNGGKLQVTSYEKGVGYKLHTDCSEHNRDPRDRYSTILVYLQDVEKGGETVFTELGIKVKPRKGRALIWNNMDSDGNCDLTSYHRAAPVIEGKKYILQRWYYYQNFPMLGKRSLPPNLPIRSHELTPRVACDEFESGSCRWYDEWNYDHLSNYSRDKSV